MEFRPLGRTGVKVSEYCLGCMMFGGKTSEEDGMDIIDRAIDDGINFIDTANAYSRGRSEEVLGKALERNGKRDSIVLATKFFAPMDSEDPNMQGNSRRHLIEQCDASLRRLKTDWIDLYQVHRPMKEIPVDETLRALDDLVRAGKVRYIGTSTFSAWGLCESLWMAKELGLNRFVSEQPPYHLLDRTIELELVPFALTYGFALIPWSPLAGGFLTGKYRRDETPPEDARYASGPRGDRHMIPAAFDVLEVVEEIANEKGCTISQLALAWCAAQPGITSPIIGPRTMEQYVDNVGAAEVEVTEEDCKRLDAVAPTKEAVVPYLKGEAGRWGPSEYRWP